MTTNNIHGFIKNDNLLAEDHHIDDLFDLESEKIKISGKLESINRSSVLGYIGKYGSGKSTLLYQIFKDKDNFIEFDAWKYPDRKELWKYFVLEIDKK